MTWIRVIDEDEATGELKKIYREIKKERGKVANILKSHSLNPQAMKDHLEFYVYLMYGDSPLTREEREMIAVCVSSANNCNYCKTHHGDALNAYWNDANKVERFKKSWRDVVRDPMHIAMLEYVEKLTKAPDSIVQGDIENLKKYFSDREILDIALITAYFNFVNRIALGLGVEVTDEERQGYRY
jgi:uncharacterized peroxidase-related enzyme